MVWSNEWGKSDDGEAANEAMKALDTPELKQIITHSGKQITVTVVGDLGLDFDADGWNIYHLPSGACFDMAVPGFCNAEPEPNCYDYDKQSLLNWMAKVQTNYPTSWIILRQLTRETCENSGKTAKEIILKWCLSVKVE